MRRSTSSAFLLLASSAFVVGAGACVLDGSPTSEEPEPGASAHRESPVVATNDSSHSSPSGVLPVSIGSATAPAGEGQASSGATGAPSGSSTPSVALSCAGACVAGGCLVTVATGQNEPYSVASDGANVYWASFADGSVHSAPATGGSTRDLAGGGQYASSLILAGGDLYWGAWNSVPGGAGLIASGQIMREPAAGGSVSVVANVPSSSVDPETLVADGRHVYWSNFGGFESIYSTPLGGGAATTLVGNDVLSTDVVYDMLVTGDRLYFITPDWYGIRSVPVAGGAVTTVTTLERNPDGQPGGASDVSPSRLALVGDSLYLTAAVNDLGAIYKVPLAGGPATVLLPKTTGGPVDMAVSGNTLLTSEGRNGKSRVVARALDASNPVTVVAASSVEAMTAVGAAFYFATSNDGAAGDANSSVYAFTPGGGCAPR